MPIPYLKTIKHKSKKDWRYKPIASSGYHNSWKKRRKKSYFPKINLSGLISKLLVVAIFGFIFIVGAFAWYGKDLPNPNKLLDREVAQSTTIYDSAGENVLYTIHGDQRRTLVKLEQIPVNLKWAAIIAEDRQFYEHSGFNIRRIFITAIKDILTGNRAGASTITQQFVKNAILTPEKKISRKIKELILSYQIEKNFTKDEILQMYFNEIPYGSNAYGAEVASQIYFDKHVEELNLAECATLAALPKAPTYYYNHIEELVTRRNYILNQMAEFEYITEQEAEIAKGTELKFAQKKGNITAPHFVMYVKEILTQKYGERAVEKGGFKVYTTLDIDKQKIAEKSIQEQAVKNQNSYNASNAALIALNPNNGDILAMVGSRDFYDEEIDGQVNVTIMPRQPGSSFKPIVYAAAFIKGYTPDTLLFDVITSFKTETGKKYEPKNYNLKEHGPVTIRKALAGSLNIPAVKAIYLAGVNNVLNLADSLGYSTLKDRSRFGLSLVLGGGEVKLLEHTNAFASFAREGQYLPTRAILRVETADGEILEKASEPIKTKALDPEIARQITNILSDNNARAYTFGASNYLTLPNRPVATKTGTTNDYRDAWTIGYTPSLVAGVWVGNNDNSEMKLGAAGGAIAAPIWQKFMREALSDSPVQSFSSPALVQTKKPVLNGQLSGNIIVKVAKISGKLASSSTPPNLIEDRTFNELHSILHYVYKDNPQGEIPSNPSSDPYYEPWEAGIRDWVNREQEKLANQNSNKDKTDSKAPFDFSVFNLPPIEFDTLHNPENQPSITILSPKNNQAINSATLNATVSVSSPNNQIHRVEYYLANELFDTAYIAPYAINRAIIKTPNGLQPFSAYVYDDVGNTAKTEVKININIEDIIPKLNWLHPQNNTAYNKSDFPINLKIEIPNPTSARTGVTLIRFYYNNRVLATNTNPNTAEPIILKWENPPPSGEYEIFAQAQTYNGKEYDSEKINIIIK